MPRQKTNPEGDYSLTVRFPRDFRQRLERLAARNWRSINAEIVVAVEQHLRNAESTEQDQGVDIDRVKVVS
jgi:hypothetical protein